MDQGSDNTKASVDKILKNSNLNFDEKVDRLLQLGVSKENAEELIKNLQADDGDWENVSLKSLSMSPNNSKKNCSSHKDSDKKVHIRRYGDSDFMIEFPINKEVTKAQLCQSYGISNQECVMIFLDYDLLCSLNKPESFFNPQKFGDYIAVFQSDFVGIENPRAISAHLRILDGLNAKSENVVEMLKEDLFALIKDEDDQATVDFWIEKKKWNSMTKWAKATNSVDIQEIVAAFVEESKKASSIPVKVEKEELSKIDDSSKPTGKGPASTEFPPENKANKTSDESGEDEDSSEDETTDEEESDESSSEQSEKEVPIGSESTKQMTPQERFLSFYEKEGMTTHKQVIVTFMKMKKWDAIQNILKNNVLLSKAFTEFLDDYKVQNPGEFVNIVSTPSVLEDPEPEISEAQPEQVILADPVEFSPDLFDFEEVINILLLGETGVGKSTFINAFANYLRYKTLAEARNNGPIIVMPIKFNSIDEDLNPIEIECKPTFEITKEDKDNEVFNIGQSCTQYAKTYLFQLGPGSKQAIRFIDTPGVGDTRGGSMDDKNFRETLAFLGGYSRIGAILVLMKPDESREDVQFSYCFEELLTHLHFSAIKNILFCFTCTREFQFTPGLTLGPLQERLKSLNKKRNLTNDEGLWTKKENVFCFDNESLRALCTWKNHHNVFDDENIKAFNKSWEISVKENFRLITRIKELAPHKTDSTICVNNIRNTIFAFGKPLAKLNENLQVNIDLIEKEERDLLNMQQNERLLETSFQANPNVQLLMSNTKELNRPVTVCTNELTNCTEIKIYKNKDQREISTINYKMKCHNPCYLEGVEREVLPNEKIKHCTAFASHGINKCVLCGCDWSKHMHIRYELIEELKTVENLKLKAELEACSDEKEKLQKVIDDRKNIRQEMEEEREMINQILARLVVFIRRNSANVYNDSFREYTEQLIKEAKKARGGDSQLVKKLEDALEEYDAQVAEFTKVPDNKEEEATIQEVNDLVTKLRRLKYCKPLLDKAEELEKKSVTKENNRKEIKVPIGKGWVYDRVERLDE